MDPPGHRGYSAVKGPLTSTGSITRVGRADESDHPQSQEKSSMKGLDTNALVRYLTQDDPKQAALASFHPEIPQIRLGCCPFTEMKRAMKDNDVRS
jgi:hypothetical protein